MIHQPLLLHFPLTLKHYFGIGTIFDFDIYKQMTEEQERYQELAEIAISKGLIKKVTQNTFGLINLSLYPYTSTRQFYNYLTLVAKAWQKLTLKASRDIHFMDKVTALCGQLDPWSEFICKVYRNVAQKVSDNVLILQRYDFLEGESQLPKIMEYNFIAVGLSVYCRIIQQSHQLFYPHMANQLINNTACEDFLDTIADHYQKRGLKGMFVMLVGEGEWRTFAQLRYFQVGLIKRGIKVRRIKLRQMKENGRLDGQKKLMFKEQEVSFVLFRHGFNIQQFQTEFKDINDAVSLKVMLAESKATCIPDISHEIVNMKVIQCQLSKPEIMRQFLNEEESQLVESSIVEIHHLHEVSELLFQELAKKIRQNPEQWIIKQNREGGSNNFFGKDILPVLESTPKEQMKGYILQKKIKSPFYDNFSITADYQLVKTRANFELGRFCITSLINGEEELKNDCGYGAFLRDQSRPQACIMAGTDSFCSWKIVDE